MTDVRNSRQPRLLIVPGLGNSGPLHWQSWLQSLHRDAVRVEQDDWNVPDLEAWAARLGRTLERAGDGPWLVAAHSFGCLAAARYLALQGAAANQRLAAVLLVAPADPDAFGVSDRLPQTRLAVPSTVIASQTDPWMSLQAARRWAQHWGSAWINLGDAGHINAASGHGPLPVAQRWVLAPTSHGFEAPTHDAAAAGACISA
jgi:hypothetical protein